MKYQKLHYPKKDRYKKCKKNFKNLSNKGYKQKELTKFISNSKLYFKVPNYKITYYKVLLKCYWKK